MNLFSYIDSIDRIARPDYLPNDKDIVKSKGKQCGLEETTIIFGQLTFRIVKPDKAILARWKLLRLFYDVMVLIFVVDLSGYDEMDFFEVKSSTHLSTALAQFENVCNSPWLAEAKIILVLNGLEVFKEKIASSPLQEYFSDYTGGADYASALAYISNKLASLKRSQDQVVIHHFVPQEDDLSLVNLVIKVVHDSIIEEKLRSIPL